MLPCCSGPLWARGVKTNFSFSVRLLSPCASVYYVQYPSCFKWPLLSNAHSYFLCFLGIVHAPNAHWIPLACKGHACTETRMHSHTCTVTHIHQQTSTDKHAHTHSHMHPPHADTKTHLHRHPMGTGRHTHTGHTCTHIDTHICMHFIHTHFTNAHDYIWLGGVSGSWLV